MDIWQKMIFPVRRLCHLALSTRFLNHRNNGGGAGRLVKLRDDVQTCEYEDVQVMWEMLHKTDQSQQQQQQQQQKRKQVPFWRVFVWSNNAPRP